MYSRCTVDSTYLHCSFSVSFFFYCYGDHRDLHSFPTRRSSDLARGSRGETTASARSRDARSAAWSTGPTRRWSGSRRDRKSTRLNSSHTVISYAVFCLKKKKKQKKTTEENTRSKDAQTEREAED